MKFDFFVISRTFPGMRRLASFIIRYEDGFILLVDVYDVKFTRQSGVIYNYALV